MQVTLAVRHFNKNKEIEDYFDERVSRLRHHLSNFKDDLIFIHGNLDRNPHKEEFYASVNVYLPSMTLHSRENAVDLLSAINLAFNAVIRQAEKFKAKLRKSYKRTSEEEIQEIQEI